MRSAVRPSRARRSPGVPNRSALGCAWICALARSAHSHFTPLSLTFIRVRCCLLRDARPCAPLVRKCISPALPHEGGVGLGARSTPASLYTAPRGSSSQGLSLLPVVHPSSPPLLLGPRPPWASPLSGTPGLIWLVCVDVHVVQIFWPCMLASKCV